MTTGDDLAEGQFMHENGSMSRIVNDRNAFVEYREFETEHERQVSSVFSGTASGTGNISVYSIIRGVQVPLLLKKALLLIESNPVNIFSERAARSNGMRFVHTEDDKYDYIAGVALQQPGSF